MTLLRRSHCLCCLLSKPDHCEWWKLQRRRRFRLFDRNFQQCPSCGALVRWEQLRNCRQSHPRCAECVCDWYASRCSDNCRRRGSPGKLPAYCPGANSEGGSPIHANPGQPTAVSGPCPRALCRWVDVFEPGDPLRGGGCEFQIVTATARWWLNSQQSRKREFLR